MTRAVPMYQRDVVELPADVVAALTHQIEQQKRSQAWIAAQLGCSTAYVNQAVKGKFRGDPERFALRVRGVFLNATVQCPVLGQVDTKTCLTEQRKPLAATNPQRVRLFRACQTCPHRQTKGT